MNSAFVPTASSAFVGVLDGVSNIMAAYSTRRLRSGHTGNIIDCRRASDNGVVALGNNGGEELDTATLATHVAAGTNGYISKYYDQGGNARDAPLSVNAKQLRITGGTTQLLLNGHVCGYSDADSMGGYSTATFTAYTGSTLTLLAVWQWQSSKPFTHLIGMVKDAAQSDDATTRVSMMRDGGNAAFGCYRNGALSSIAVSNSVTYAGSARFSGSACNLRQGSNTATPASSGSFDTNRIVLAGSINDTGDSSVGYYPEFIIIGADATDAVVQTIQTNQRAYWGAS